MVKSTAKLRVLLWYPETPNSQWELQGSLPYIEADSSSAPLGLVTIAALMPLHWDVSLHDVNIDGEMTEQMLRTFDVVMPTGMHIHRVGIAEILDRCKALGIPTVLGGPFVSADPTAKEVANATSRFIGEAETDDFSLFSAMMKDVENGTLQHEYRPSGFGTKEAVYPVIGEGPLPRWDLLKVNRYAALAIQATRGCPWKCNFCSVTAIFGRKFRYKTPLRIIHELQALYDAGHRGGVMFVDDNFGANRKLALPIARAIALWQNDNGRPYSFYTQSDVKLLTQYHELADAMRDAGFHTVLVGFEDTSDEAVKAMKKGQNKGVIIPDACAKGRANGILTFPALMVGLKPHGTEVFERMRGVIYDSDCSVVMVSMLNAVPGTEMYNEYLADGRVLNESITSNISGSNIIPYGMTRIEMYTGFRDLLQWAYGPDEFFRRATREVESWKAGPARTPIAREIRAMLRSFRNQGFKSEYRSTYRRFLYTILKNTPSKFPRAVAIAIYYAHFAKYIFDIVIPDLNNAIAEMKAEQTRAA